MKLNVIASGSTGNSYILEGRDSALILECGVSPERLMRATTVPISHIAGCLVTHEHGDHAKAAARYAALGLDVYSSAGTLHALGLHGHRYHPLAPMFCCAVGGFVVRSFPVHHDAAEPFGYMIEHPEMGRLLFITDTRQVDYSFRSYNVAHILCEANYSDDVLDANVLAGRIDGHRARRVRDTHLSLRGACELVKANETPALRTVTLIHLSAGNSDEGAFAQRMRQNVLLADVYIARAGLTVNLNKNQFDTK